MRSRHFSPVTQDLYDAYLQDPGEINMVLSDQIALGAALRVLAQSIYHDWSSFEIIDHILGIAEELQDYKHGTYRCNLQTQRPFTASLRHLGGKHYGSIIDLRDERGHEYQVKLWISDPTHRMSQRQLDYYNYASNEEAQDDGMPCDCHYESERQYLLAQAIVNVINNFKLPLVPNHD